MKKEITVTKVKRVEVRVTNCRDCPFYGEDHDMSASIPDCSETDAGIKGYLIFHGENRPYNSIAENCPYKKYTLSEIRDFVEEYFFLRCNNGGIVRDEEYGDPDECGQIELNQFLRWLGVKRPIGDKLGWDNIKKSCIGKRKENQKEVRKKAKEIIKTMKP